MIKAMRLQISPDFLYLLVITQLVAAQEFLLDSQPICGSTDSQTPTCGGKQEGHCTGLLLIIIIILIKLTS